MQNYKKKWNLQNKKHLCVHKVREHHKLYPTKPQISISKNVRYLQNKKRALWTYIYNKCIGVVCCHKLLEAYGK